MLKRKMMKTIMGDIGDFKFLHKKVNDLGDSFTKLPKECPPNSEREVYEEKL